MLKKYPIKLLAEKVEDKEDFLFCTSLGFEYFQGYFFAKPEIITGKSIFPEQAILFRLFNSLARGDDMDVIEKTFKQSPQLDYKLLKFMNSAAFYMSQKVTSIRHAIAMIGYHNLQKWIALLLFANQTDDMKSNPLLERATMRGIIMELLAQKATSSRIGGDTSFIVGILSLIDTLLSIPLSDAISDLNLSPEISNALLKREGLPSILLDVVEKLEQQDFGHIERTINPLNICLNDVLAIETKAITEYEKMF
jgi:EAL and modified HD-GYP domain-containing signal transduction protein